MKKLLALLLALLAIVAFSACSKDGESGDQNDDQYKKDDTVITEVTDNNGDTFHFVSVDSETVSITKFDSTNDRAHTVTIPAYLDGKAVVNIAEEAFAHISNIETVIFPTVEDYLAGDENFDAAEFNFTITRFAFRNCDGLSTLTLPAYVSEIGEAAFYGCAQLSSVTIADGSKLTAISANAFMNCPKLAAVSLPGSIDLIGKGAFFGAVSLESIAIPEGVLRIEAQAFQNCTALKTVALPTTLSEEVVDEKTTLPPIGAYAFAGSEVLTSVTYTGTNEAVLDYIDGLDLVDAQ